jgi:Tfp pilus assembly protein PilX
MSMQPKDSGVADRATKPIVVGQGGIALLTVMMFMLIMTVIGVAAITVTGLENRMAGFTRTGETAATAADSCVGVGANIIRQALMPANVGTGAIPLAFLSTAGGPVPATNSVILFQEIYGKDSSGVVTKNSPDTATGVPNLTLTVNGFTVNGDIDYLYNENTTATGGAVTNTYRINCVATNVAVGASSSVTAVYACTLVAGSTECSKKF